MLTSFLIGKALPLLLKIIVGPLAYLLGRVILNGWRSLDNLPPIAKRVIVFLISMCIAAFFQITGQALPQECSGVALGELTDGCVALLSSAGFLNTMLTGAIGAGLAFLIHAAKKSDPRS